MREGPWCCLSQGPFAAFGHSRVFIKRHIVAVRLKQLMWPRWAAHPMGTLGHMWQLWAEVCASPHARDGGLPGGKWAPFIGFVHVCQGVSFSAHILCAMKILVHN